MSVREGAWDCKFCGRRGNRGSSKFCGGCGAPRGNGTEFYLPEDAPAVTDPEELKRAMSGPDWNCSYCGGDNPAMNTFCSGCGAARESDSTCRKSRIIKISPEISETVPDEAEYRKERPVELFSGSSGQGRKILFFIIFSILAVIAFGLVFGITREEVLTVSGMKWERSISVEAYKTLKESAWEGSVPKDAKIISKSREIHHYDRIKVGEERRSRKAIRKIQVGTERVRTGARDLGNGYFEDIYEERPIYREEEFEEIYYEPVYRNEPVYRERYVYEVDRWVRDRIETVSGEGRDAYWPLDRIKKGERADESTRTERYTVLFVNEKGQSRVYEPGSYDEYLFFETGEKCLAEVNFFGKIKTFKKDRR